MTPPFLPPERVAGALRGADRLAALRRAGLLDTPGDPALDRIAAAAARLLDAPVALVTLVGTDRQRLAGCAGLPEPWLTRREASLAHTFCPRVVAAGEPFVLEDARAHPALAPSPAVAELGLVAYLGVPLAAPGGEVLGAVCVADRERRAWSPRDVEGVAELARWAAAEVALRMERGELRRARASAASLAEALRVSRAELEGAVEERTAELRRAVARLRGSEEDARRLFEGMGDGVLVVDPGDGTVLDANPAACAVLGLARESLLGRPVPLPGVLEAPSAASSPAPVRAVHPRGDGERVHLDVLVSAVERGGRPVLLCNCRDVTPRVRAEQALRASEERFRSVVERMAEGLVITDLESRIVYANPRTEDIFGWKPEELLGRVSWEVLVDAGERKGMAERIPRRVAGEQERYEVRSRRRDGSTGWIEVAAAPFRNAEGEVVGTLGAVTDVTERRRIREALERSLSLLRATLDATTDGILAVDLEGRVTGYNARFLEMWGLEEAESLVRADRLREAARRLRDPEGFLAGVRASRSVPEAEMRDELHFRDGRVFERVLRPQRLDGRVVGRVWSFHDVTERHRAAEALAAQRAYLRAVIDAIPSLVFAKDGEGRFVLANRALAAHFGRTPDAVLGTTDAFLTRDPVQAARFLEADRRVLRSGGQLVMEEPVPRPGTGELRWFQTRKVALLPPGGGAPQLLGIATDITDRRRAEAALRESEALFRAIFDGSAVGMALLDTEGRLLRANAAFDALLGRGPGVPGDEPLERLLHPDDREAHRDRLRALVARETGHYHLEARVARGDGGLIRARFTASLVEGSEGRAPFVVGWLAAVTPRHAAEEALAESQRQLVHSQKMEAVGRLAGGIAHDFNNMLMAIGGHAELLRTLPDISAEGRWHADEIRRAGDRAAGLTRQLLAFSRKQVLQPRLLSLNAVVAEMEDMLRRLIGEDVRLCTSLDPGAGVVRADPGQLQQVLMNLAVNARDAMPGGGTLAVATQNVVVEGGAPGAEDDVVPGRYVLLSVGDTGTGMSESVRQRIFEPFFTTKPQGQGTGLGLSTVYGIVRQSGGYIRLESEVGAGSTFRIYLPREDAPTEAAPAAAPVPAPRGSETVLLVEDDEVVRGLLALFLRRQGYDVVAAPSGADALSLAAAHPSPPRLLLTDVVMPGGMSGRALAAAVRERWPEVRVIYMSGYTDEAIERQGVLDPGSAFVQKPVAPDVLAHRLRAVLDAPR